MSTQHSKAAARFIENRAQEQWHDETDSFLEIPRY